MMVLLQSIEYVDEVNLKRDGLLRWRLEKSKQTRHLYQCDKCNKLVTLYNAHPVGECSCVPCRECGKTRSHGKHSSNEPATAHYNPIQGVFGGALGGIGYAYSQYHVSAPAPADTVQKKSPATHYYQPERRRTSR